MEPYGPVLPVPVDLKPEERAALSFQLNPIRPTDRYQIGVAAARLQKFTLSDPLTAP